MLDNSVVRLREMTGLGMIPCKEALQIFHGNINQAAEYLRCRGLAVARRKPDGTRWSKQDYIDYIKETII